AMGIFARDQLAGVLLLGPRRSGRIYGAVEQSALQVLCGQLAVAIENAELFTEVQNAKIYNETLLRSEERRVGKESRYRSGGRHTRSDRDWSSDVCSSDLGHGNLCA